MFETSAPHLPAAFLPPPLDADTALMLRFQAGDQAAFAELYRRHYDAVAKVCRRILNGRAPPADLAHDTFVTACERRDQWRPQGNAHCVRAWFTTIATRKCLDLVRRASTRRERPDDLSFEIPIDPETTDHRCLELLAAAVAELPEEQREVISMKVEQGLTYREIAELTGIPEPALKSRFRLARHKLTRRLAAAGVTREELDD
jgi:RNA polymerase sigma factor (sigma-70 family)